MAADSTNDLSQSKRLLVTGTRRSVRFVLQSPRYAVETIVLLVACLQIVRATDPYAAALDRRFSTGTTPTEAPDSGVAALEAGIRAQALELSQPPEPSPPPAADGAEQCWRWALGVAGAFGAGLVSVITLRRWNQGQDQPDSKLARAKTVMAEDPSMAAFLWALNERAQTSPVAATSGTSGSPDPMFGMTAGGQVPADHVHPDRGRASVREHLAVFHLQNSTPQTLTWLQLNLDEISLVLRVLDARSPRFQSNWPRDNRCL